MQQIIERLHSKISSGNFDWPMPNVILGFLRILLQCGADANQQATNEYIQRLKSQEQTFEKYDKNAFRKNIEWLKNWFIEPASLRFFCRKTFRKTFRKQLSTFVKNLNYPK